MESIKTLKELRVEMGLKQSDVAEMFGVAQTTFSKWENDPSKVAFGIIVKLAEIYNHPIDKISLKNIVEESDEVIESNNEVIDNEDEWFDPMELIG